jgi:methylenetetrahydrofolate dehydrogenase (NADP+)/methenyltetrahydrofolate cyclohydrolase
MARVLDGKEVAAQVRAEVAQEVHRMTAAGARPPGLTAVLVGDDPASRVYVGSKIKACEEAGIASHTVRLPASVSASELAAAIDELNADDTVDGILVQLPLPKGLPEREVLERVDPAKDVDGFHPVNIGRLWADEAGFVPATPAGIMEMLRRYEIPLAGRRAVVVGRSLIVGKPIAGLLLREHCTVTICHSRTRDLPALCREADVLVAAIGRPAMLGADSIGEGAVVIDVGINRIDDRALVERLFPGDEKRLETLERRGSVLVGDVDYTAAAEKASAITPVPGGVGPLTVAMVIANTLTASRRRQGLGERA